MPRYPALPRRLLKQLGDVPPSLDRDVKYYPCAVILDDGRELERVYVMPMLNRGGLGVRSPIDSL